MADQPREVGDTPAMGEPQGITSAQTENPISGFRPLFPDPSGRRHLDSDTLSELDPQIRHEHRDDLSHTIAGGLPTPVHVLPEHAVFSRDHPARKEGVSMFHPATQLHPWELLKYLLKYVEDIMEVANCEPALAGHMAHWSLIPPRSVWNQDHDVDLLRDAHDWLDDALDMWNDGLSGSMSD